MSANRIENITGKKMCKMKRENYIIDLNSTNDKNRPKEKRRRIFDILLIVL